jgi:uncharacterized membrane protein YjgN (DUF898 family)
VAETEQPTQKKEKAQTEQPALKKEKTTVIAFSGTGWGLLGHCLALLLSGVLAFIPLPVVTVGIRKWFYRNLSVTDSGKAVSFSFEGSAIALLKYWIPSLVLMGITGASFYFGISESPDGFLSFLLILISILALLPQAWLWAAKRRYTVAHTKATVGTTPVTFAFSGQGTSALLHGLKMLFSLFAAGLPMPWAVTGAARWCLEATDISADTSYKPAFSGKGGSLFWYGVGIVISPFFLFLIVPSILRGVIAWAARYTNIIGLDKTIEFEFVGTAGRLFGYVYLLLLLSVLGLVVNLALGTAVSELIRSALVTLVFLVTLPFVAASFIRWCAQHIEVVKK